ncbi:MAG: hypothetical protein ABIG96_06890 [Candidatus Micrarchaeota archaeon]
MPVVEFTRKLIEEVKERFVSGNYDPQKRSLTAVIEGKDVPPMVWKSHGALQAAGYSMQTPLVEYGAGKAFHVVLTLNNQFKPKKKQPDERIKKLSEAGALLFVHSRKGTQER